jgi:hypothetical protein
MEDSSDEIRDFALGKRKRKKRDPKYNVDEITKSATDDWDNMSSWLKLTTNQKEHVNDLQKSILTSH